jgi:YD repeat-containing protein
MEFKTTNLKSQSSAFTLPELIISVLLGTLLLLAVMSFYGFSLTSFASMTNYADLNNQSRNTSDLVSRDIRASTSVASATAYQLVLHAPDGTNISYTYDAAGGSLTRVKGRDSRTVLKGITSLTFSLYQRPTNSYAAYEQFPAGTASNAKLVAFQWTCSRRVAGPINDSETLEAAMVQMRNE